MKIAIDCHTLEVKDWAGKEQFLFSIIKEIVKSGDKNQYILYFRNPVFKNNFFPNNFTVKNYNYFTPFWQLRVFWDMLVNKIDILFSPCTYLLPAISLTLSSVIIVYDITAFLPQIKNTHKITVRLREKFFLKLAMFNSKFIAAISDSTRNDLLKYFEVKSDKIFILPGAADARFKLINKENSQVFKILEKYNIRGKYLLSVGTLEPRKNILRTIEGYRRLLKNNIFSEYKLVIVGKKGWFYEDIFNQVKKINLENKIIFTGYAADEDMPYLYNGAACFIYPSLYEGFGLPVIEAMSCGCPVITSNTSSLPEVGGNAALYIDPYDIDEISAAIKRILSDEKLRDEMKSRGLKQSDNFSWEKSTQKLLNTFDIIYNNKNK